MGDFAGPQLFDSNTLPSPAELSLQPPNFSPFDFLPAHNSFGFSPGTSPAPIENKNHESDLFFGPQSRIVPTANSSFLRPEDFLFPSSVKNNNSYHPASPQSAHQPSRLIIPSTTTKQEHGQLTPPSDTSPTKETPPTGVPQPSVTSPPPEMRTGPTTRKRRNTQPSQMSATLSQPPSTPRRRKKTTRKQNSADSDDKRSQFLERNRVAASKCRQKKKEWTSNLEQRARELQASKTSLALLVSSLREELLYLKGEALKHTTCDCNSIREYLARHAESRFSRGALDFGHSPHSGSNFSFEALNLNPSTIQDSPNSSAMADNQDLPELNILGLIPD